MDQALEARKKLSAPCSFRSVITADYGETVYSFVMDCACDADGILRFTVAEPESIAGIQGEISGKGGKITFEDQAVAFSLLADGQVSPVSGPWLLMKTLRSGYLTSCNQEEEFLRLTVNDSYEEDALTLDIWLRDSLPVRGEILFRGKRILTVEVSDFTLG